MRHGAVKIVTIACAALALCADRVEAQPREAAPRDAGAKQGRVALYANLLGALEVGASLGVEAGYRSFGIALRGRSLNTGLIPYTLADFEIGGAEFDWGYGVALAPRYYFAGNGALTGTYFGGSVEFIHAHGTAVGSEWDPKFIIVAAEGGHRWAFDSGLFIGVGAWFGVGSTIAGVQPAAEVALPIGMLAFDLGIWL